MRSIFALLTAVLCASAYGQERVPAEAPPYFYQLTVGCDLTLQDEKTTTACKHSVKAVEAETVVMLAHTAKRQPRTKQEQLLQKLHERQAHRRFEQLSSKLLRSYKKLRLFAVDMYFAIG